MVSIDERVGRVLAQLTEDLSPRPDPYGRVLARIRRYRRRRITAAGCALVLLAAGGVAGSRLAGTPDSPPAAVGDSWEQILGWGQRMVRSPPRGAVGQDAAYVTALAEALQAEQAAGRIDRLPTPAQDVRVIFVDDVGPYRIAFAVFLRSMPDPTTGWPHAGRWFVGPRGAEPAALGRASAVQGGSDGLEPRESLVQGVLTRPDELVVVSVVPDGCRFETTTDPESNAWAPEPTGSYLVRTSTERPEWWQVSCDGVVRERGPAPGSLAPTGLDDRQYAEANASARGTVDPEAARLALNGAAGSWGYEIAALPTMLWGGETRGTPGGRYDGQAVILTAPRVGGGWIGALDVRYPRRADDGTIGSGAQFSTRTDPTAPGSVVAVRPSEESNSILVVAPPQAATLHALRDGRELAVAPIVDSAALLNVPDQPGLVLEARDPGGAVLGAAEVAGPDGGGLARYDWSKG